MAIDLHRLGTYFVAYFGIIMAQWRGAQRDVCSIQCMLIFMRLFVHPINYILLFNHDITW